jgi:hypothetical protein
LEQEKPPCGTSNGLTFVVQPAMASPTCHITLNKTSFVNGDPFTIQALHFANPNPVRLLIEYKLWVYFPTGGTYPWMRGGENDSVWLEAGANFPNVLGGPRTLTTIDSSLPRGAYLIACRL